MYQNQLFHPGVDVLLDKIIEVHMEEVLVGVMATMGLAVIAMFLIVTLITVVLVIVEITATEVEVATIVVDVVEESGVVFVMSVRKMIIM